MEIKVLCPCGAKYQFPVEPVNGMLPRSIACPVCGADNTALGNEAIQQQLPAAPPSAPAAPQKPGLKVRAAESEPPAAPLYTPPPPVSPVHRPAYAASTSGSSAGIGSKIGSIAKKAVSIILVIIGLFALYAKWSRRIGRLTNLVKAESTESASDLHWTLPDGSALLVKHSNHTNVADALAAAHLKLVNQKLAVTSTTNIFEAEGTYFVNQVHNGTVFVGGNWDWSEAKDEKSASDIAADLSKELNTTILMALLDDDGEAGICAIFENGERKFRLKRWYEIKSLRESDLKEFVERDGAEWATQHGYVADPDKVLSGDSDKAPFQDVNALTLKLGMDISDVEYEDGAYSLVLKPEAAAAPAAAPKGHPSARKGTKTK